MSQSEWAPTQKLVQYLEEALSTEMGVKRSLQGQIAITPRGRYRSALERHLEETNGHARRLRARLSALGGGEGAIGTAVGLVELLMTQTLALYKLPFDLVRGSGGEEKILKNAKDACAAEALEIATYTALERLATSIGDEETAALAASIRADEERMLARLLREVPALTAAVVGAALEDEPGYDPSTTGAAEAVQETVRTATDRTRKTIRKARSVPGVTRLEGDLKGAVASADDLAIARYDELTADEVVARLGDLSQIDLAKVEGYERAHQDRTTVLSRIDGLRGTEPWPGYDELTVADIRRELAAADDDRAATVRAYERAHKARSGVLAAAERELATA